MRHSVRLCDFVAPVVGIGTGMRKANVFDYILET